MKHLFYISVLCLLLLCQAKAQHSRLPDSLRHILAAMPTDTTRVDSLIEWSYSREDSLKPYEKQFAEEALALANRIKYAKGQGDSFVKLGTIALKHGDYLAADSLYQLAGDIRQKIPDWPGLASCYNNRGLVQKRQSNYEGAVNIYLRGLSLLEGSPSNENLAMLHNNLGTTLRYRGRYDEALYHFRKCMELGIQLKLPERIASARLNIAVLLQDNRYEYKQARDSLQRCLEYFERERLANDKAKSLVLLGNNAYFSNDLQKAREYYEAALRLNVLDANDSAIADKNLVRIKLDQGQYEEALEQFQASLKAFESLHNEHEIASVHYQIGCVHYEQNQWNPAIENYQKALGIDPQDPLLKSRILLFLSEAQDQAGFYQKASANRSRMIGLIDSLGRDSLGNMGTSILYDQLRISNTNSSLRLQQAEAKRKKWQAYGLIGFAVMWLLLSLAIMGYYLNRQKRRLAEQNEKLAQQEVIELLREKELEANYAWLDGQEEARKKIGRELHDGLGSLLTTIKLHFSSVDSRLDDIQDENRRQYNRANHLLDEACEEVRRISHEMMSAILVKFGLKAQLEALADTIRSSGKLRVELDTHGLGERLSTKLEFNIYRVAQELVNNVIRHARAEKLSIQVNRFEEIINILVEDNGAGFSLEQAQAAGGMGLKNLSSRIHGMEGTLNIDSRIGQGTTVSIDIPI